MLRLGEKQALVIVKIVEFGVYLAKDSQSGEKERVLLPGKQVPQGAKVGDEIEVFLYKDSKDRMIATTRMPKLTLHGTARLKVVQVGKIGAFLDWGLEKDLLLPFREQTTKVAQGQSVLVALYIDKSSRLCATMNVYEYLENENPYKKDEWVEGTVYEISRDFGAFVAVDDRYSALISKKELYGKISVGDRVRARVAEVREDGRLGLSLREKAYLQMAGDAEKIMDAIGRHGGRLPFNDKADPEVIRREMQMSKNEFKRAVGRLLKEGKVRITDSSIVKES